MRIITINAWGGRSMHPLMRFFRHRKEEADVFCIQEAFDCEQSVLDAKRPDEHVRGDMFRRICGELPDFTGAFARFEDDPSRMSLAVFVRKSLPIAAIEDFIVHVPAFPMDDGKAVLSSRKLQTVRIGRDGGDLLIANYHGLWVNGPKTDTSERIAQSRDIVAALAKHPGPKVLVGDFNLLPDTASVRMLETEAGLRNLVVEHGVTSTRTPLYRHYENPAEPNFADYVMPSHDLVLKRFEVLPDIVSDHSPLFVEFA
ncbi:MAG: endonuclease/exonuclease/phosphatase family protein [Patescibacteria group bacterium]